MKNLPLLALRQLLVLCFLCTVSWAQSNFVQGRLLDSATDEPVVFATIRVKGWSKGVVSNNDGGFRIPQKFQQLNDTLLISSMGYETLEISLSQLSVQEINIIYLKPTVFELNESVLVADRKRGLRAKEIVRKALRNIPFNYPRDSFSLLGYYRDYQWHQNDYLNLNEAIVEVFDAGFGTRDQETSTYGLYYLKENTDFKRDSISSSPYDYKTRTKVVKNAFLAPYGGNELLILRVHDALRNYDYDSYSFIYKMKSQLLPNHKFKREVDTYLDGESYYTITFVRNTSDHRAFGKMVISKQDFAIYKLDYALYDSAKVSKKEVLSRHGAHGKLIFDVTCEYRPKDGLMFLNYISFTNGFEMAMAPRFRVKDISLNIKDACLEVNFNETPDMASTQHHTNYAFWYYGKRLPIKSVSLSSTNPTKVLVYPKFNTAPMKSRFFEDLNTLSKEGPVPPEVFSYELKNITDIHGNLIHKRYDFKEYVQYREFFVQEVRTDGAMPQNEFLMQKNLPVFSGQPIAPFGNLIEYWMNTPLKG